MFLGAGQTSDYTGAAALLSSLLGAKLLRAEKEFLALRDRRLRRALRDAIDGLAADPRPPACRKMVGTVDEGRIKVSDWRVIYRIEEGRLVVPVVRVGPRKDVYR